MEADVELDEIGVREARDRRLAFDVGDNIGLFSTSLSADSTILHNWLEFEADDKWRFRKGSDLGKLKVGIK